MKLNYKILWVIALATLVVFNSCNNRKKLISIKGSFLNRPYSVSYTKQENASVTKAEIDSLFAIFSATYDIKNPNSLISQFNKTGKIKITNEYLLPCLDKNRELYELTNGIFDPTIGKLVEIYGLNFENIDSYDSLKVKEAIRVIGFDKIKYTSDSLIATTEGVNLDFGATYRGQAVDALIKLVNAKGIQNYLIETDWGTEAKGKNNNKSWITKKKLGKTETDSIVANVKQINYSVANTDNHVKFFNRNGVKFAYTLNPITGFPAESDVLSAYIFAQNCMTANGLSTACMALGFEKSKELTKKLKNIRFIITYTNSNAETICFDSFGK